MKIKIYYQLNSEVPPNVLELTPQEYFDPLDEDQTFEEDAIAKFTYAKDYLGLNPEELKWTNTCIEETNNDHKIRVEYYKGGHFMWHRKNSNGYEEICIATQISDLKVHISRTHKNPDSIWQVNYSGIIEDLADGSQKAVDFITYIKTTPF